jgi:O-antigen ligase
MFIYCARPEEWIPGLSAVPLAKVAGTMAFLALLFSLRQIRLRLPREVLYLALLIGQLFLACALSPIWRGGAFEKTLDFAKVLIVVIVISVAVNTLKRLHLLIFTQAASVAAIAAVTLWKGHLLLGRLEGILGGIYADPNDLALGFVISLPMCLALLFLTRSWLWKAVWMFAILLMTLAIFLTGSRGGLVSLFATAAISLWAFAIRGRRPYLLLLAALLGVIAVMSSGDLIMRRLQETFDVEGNGAAAHDSAQTRQQLFWRSVEVTEQHPIFGVGPGNFQQISGMWHVAHNSYTQMSSEGGIPALILYVLILLSAFRNLRSTGKIAGVQDEIVLLAKALNASMVGYIIGSCFLSLNYEFFPYLLMAYTTALLLIAKKSSGSFAQDESRSRGNPLEGKFSSMPRAIDSPLLAP